MKAFQSVTLGSTPAAVLAVWGLPVNSSLRSDDSGSRLVLRWSCGRVAIFAASAGSALRLRRISTGAK